MSGIIICQIKCLKIAFNTVVGASRTFIPANMRVEI